MNEPEDIDCEREFKRGTLSGFLLCLCCFRVPIWSGFIVFAADPAKVIIFVMLAILSLIIVCVTETQCGDCKIFAEVHLVLEIVHETI